MSVGINGSSMTLVSKESVKTYISTLAFVTHTIDQSVEIKEVEPIRNNTKGSI